MNPNFDIISTPLESAIPANPFSDPRIGGVCTFHGIIRNHNEGQVVQSLEYEADIPLSLAEASRIFAEAHARFDILEVKALHRVGHLRIGEMAIWAAVGAAHRQAAFDAVEYIVHEIKHRLPIWKKEHYVSGSPQWVSCCPSAHRPLDPEIYYSRQSNLSLVGRDGQDKLQQARILVVGAGGLGNYALTHLAASGIGTIGICEHDRLSLHNLHRQTLYTTDELNQPKALLAQQRLNRINPFINVHLHQEKLVAGNVDHIAAPYDVIIDGTDNFETKFLLNDYCVLHRKPLIQASVYQFEGQLTFYQPQQPDATCLRCLWSEMPEPNCVGNCQQAGVMGFTPGILGTWQAAEAIKHILGLPTLAANATLLINLLTNEIQTIKQKRRSTCSVCGPHPTITSIARSNYRLKPCCIDPAELTADDLTAFTLIDIRDDAERRTEPFPATAPHVHIPLQAIIDNPLILNPQQKSLLICTRGARSQHLALILQTKNIRNTFSLKEGLSGLYRIMETRA